MSVIEIVFAILLILSCVFIIAIVLMQESKQGMSNVISGGSADNYFQKNSGRTKEAKLSRATKVAAVIVFLAAIAVNLISVYWGGEAKTGSNDSSIGVSGDIHGYDSLSYYRFREFFARVNDYIKVWTRAEPAYLSEPVSLDQSGDVTTW